MSTPHPTRTEDVFSTLRHEVLTGQYRPGERLPRSGSSPCALKRAAAPFGRPFGSLKPLG